MMFDGGGTVEGAELNGCWATCHSDLRTMKNAKDDKKTKYIKDGDLASGKFMDLMQFRSGKGEKPVDGYVADNALHGRRQGSASRPRARRKATSGSSPSSAALAGGGKGDHAIAADKIYNFGFAIHEDYTNARFHYVSLGYQFGLDKASPKA